MYLLPENPFGRPRKHPIGDDKVFQTRYQQAHAQDATFTIDYEFEIQIECMVGSRSLYLNVDNSIFQRYKWSFQLNFSKSKITLEFNDSNKIDKYMALNINKADFKNNDAIFND